MAQRTATAPRTPERLPWTGDEAADRLIAADPVALLVGFCLDQQVTLQKAFLGPLVIRDRLGTIDPHALATADPERVAAAFRKPPAVHRFPAAMAARVQALCRSLVADYGGDATRVWREAADADDLARRLEALPGIGPMKSRTIGALLAKQYGVRPAGWEARLPQWMTLADADTAERLAEYQARKRAFKAEQRARGERP